MLSNGDAGTYVVEDGTVIMINPVFGAAQGRVAGSTLVFPEVGEGNLVGASFAGTWTQIAQSAVTFPINGIAKGEQDDIEGAIEERGYIALYPGMSSDRAESYRGWQVEVVPLIGENRGENVWIIPADEMERIREHEQRVYRTEKLPFAIVINGFARNATPVPVNAPAAAETSGREIDGFKLAPQRPANEAEQNLPGSYVEFRPDGGGDPVEAILWAGSSRFDPREHPMPFVFEVEGQRYGALLAKKSWQLPFTVRLDEFAFDRDTGSGTARNFESRVTRFEEGNPERPVKITMNEPMRHAGYTFSIESFGPVGTEPGDEMFTQFAVGMAVSRADSAPSGSDLVERELSMFHREFRIVATSRERFRYQTRAETSASETASRVPQLTYTTPEGWSEVETSRMRDINLSFGEDGEGECYVARLPGAGGVLAATVNRWRSQMGADPLSDEEVAALPRQPLFGQAAVYVEVDGDYTPGMGTQETFEDYRLLGLILASDAGAVFVKMTGPRELVEANEEAFEIFTSSIDVILVSRDR